jgi:hypothetical protein
MPIAEDLDLDMACMPHQFFEINLVLAEGRFRAALGTKYCVDQLFFAFNRAHSAPALRCLDHQGKMSVLLARPPLGRSGSLFPIGWLQVTDAPSNTFPFR